MRANLVTLVHDLTALVREGFDGMAGNEEGRLEIIFLEKPEQTGNADLAGEDAALDIGRRITATVRSDPTRNGVYIRSECADDFLFGHSNSPVFAAIETRLQTLPFEPQEVSLSLMLCRIALPPQKLNLL